jgi:glycosyltransferase involved in cell wall biosynthesis
VRKLVRITTVPLSLEKLLENQLTYMTSYFEVIAASSDQKRLEKYGQENKVRTFHLPLTRTINPLKDLKAAYQLYVFLKNEKPDIVHSHTPKAGIVGMLAAWLARVPIRMHTIAGLPLLESRGNKRRLLIAVERLTSYFATNVYPNSFGLQEIVLNMHLAPRSKVNVIGHGSSNGINLDYFNSHVVSDELKANLRKDFQFTSENQVLIFIGRVVKDKGVNELVSAFKLLSRNNSNLRLLIVGDYESELNDVTPETKSEISSNPSIFHTGFRQDVRPYLAISNLFVFPSYREGFPNSVLQALAMNIPCIVSDINGCNEIVQQHSNGVLIPVKSVQAIVEAVEDILHTKEKLQFLAQNARSSILVYDRKKVCKDILDEYDRLLASRHN